MLGLKLVMNFNKQHEPLTADFFSVCKMDNRFTQTVTIAKVFQSLLHNLHSSITKWSVSKNTDLLFLFVI